MVKITNVNYNVTISDNDIKMVVAGLIGKVCCRQRVGRGRSLSLGFGAKVLHGNSRLIDDFYGEWEIGTYSAAWRVVKDEKVLCGSQDPVSSLEELDSKIRKIQLGKIKEIYQPSSFDVRVTFDEGIHIDFLAVADSDDELLHFFCPENIFAKYSVAEGWVVTKADLADSNLKCDS